MMHGQKNIKSKRVLGGPQIQPGFSEEDQNLLLLLGNEQRLLCYPAHNLFTIPNELSRPHVKWVNFSCFHYIVSSLFKFL